APPAAPVHQLPPTSAASKAHTQLPRLLCLDDLERVQHDPPIRYYRAGTLVEVRETVDLTLRFDGELPFDRDVTPMLWVGDVGIDGGKRVGLHRYRFSSHEPSKLTAGSRLSFGWPGARSQARHMS